MRTPVLTPLALPWDGVGRYPVGVLSAIDRDWAAELRPELVAMNKEAMHDIDSALFCVTLDDEAPTDDSALSRLMLHGNGRNRWFEKSFHIVVAANGKAGVNWEHSWGDGVAMLRFFEEVYKEISAEPARPKAEAAAPAKAFDFCLSPNLQANIVKAEKVTDEFFASAELEVRGADDDGLRARARVWGGGVARGSGSDGGPWHTCARMARGSRSCKPMLWRRAT